MKEKPVINILKQFGFTEPQARLFYAGLVNGPSLMAHLAKKAKIPRGTAYFLMKEMQRRGFFILKKCSKRNLYLTAPGKRLLEMTKERERLIKKLISYINGK